MSGNDDRRGGLSVKTLAIASAASALATYLVPMIWRPGTIAAAAATPVIVALISEALSRPADHVSQAGRLVRAPRRGLRRRAPGLSADEVKRRRRRLAVVTGLLGFLVAGVVITTTELATGEAVSGGGHRTSLLGGEADTTEDEDAPSAPTPVPEAPTATAPEGAATPAPQTTPSAPTQEATPAPVAPSPEGTPTPAPTPVTPGATPAPTTP